MIKKYSQFKLNEMRVKEFDVYTNELIKIGFTKVDWDDGWGDVWKMVNIPLIGECMISISNYEYKAEISLSKGNEENAGDLLLTLPLNKKSLEWLKTELNKCK